MIAQQTFSFASANFANCWTRFTQGRS